MSNCILISDAKYEWFEKWENFRTHKRGDEYDQYKEKFAQKLLEIVYEKVKFKSFILLQITKKNADTRIQQQKFVILFYQILAYDNEIACYGMITDYCCLIAYIALGYSINLLVSYNLKVLTNKEFKRKLFPEISTI